MEWIFPPSRPADEVNAAIARWIGTKYGRARAVGQAVDCVQFPAAILDELYGCTSPTPIPRLPAFASVSGRAGWKPVILAYNRGWGGLVRIRDGKMAPGDMVVCPFWAQSTTSEPGHLMIATGTPFEFAHSTQRLGVHRVRFGADRPILGHYRVKNGWRN